MLSIIFVEIAMKNVVRQSVREGHCAHVYLHAFMCVHVCVTVCASQRRGDFVDHCRAVHAQAVPVVAYPGAERIRDPSHT